MSPAAGSGAGGTQAGESVVTGRTGLRWVTVVGLEVHCQLATETKLFCGCAYVFGAEPNTITCPLCTGQPGSPSIK